jgi:hypothetical protein
VFYCKGIKENIKRKNKRLMNTICQNKHEKEETTQIKRKKNENKKQHTP